MGNLPGRLIPQALTQSPVFPPAFGGIYELVWITSHPWRTDPHLSFSFIDTLIYPLWIYRHRICKRWGGDDMASDGGYISPGQTLWDEISWLKSHQKEFVCVYVSSWCVNCFCFLPCFSPSWSLCWGIRWSIRQRWATPGLVSLIMLSFTHTLIQQPESLMH